jgi:hypothetical protein
MGREITPTVISISRRQASRDSILSFVGVFDQTCTRLFDLIVASYQVYVFTSKSNENSMS